MVSSSENLPDSKYFLLVGALLSLPVSAGAAGVFHDTSMDFGSIRTVAVLPLVNLTREQQASDRVRDVFVTALMANSGIYVVPSGEVARGDHQLQYSESDDTDS